MMIVLQSLISIALIFVLVFVLFNEHRVARLRSALFEIRDELFDEAVAGNVSFQSPAYEYARGVLNGMIRFAHKVSISRFIASLLFVERGTMQTALSRQRAALNASPTAEREIVLKYLRRANRTIAKHLGTSPFLFVLALPIGGMYILATGVSLATAAVEKLRAYFVRLDDVAFEQGAASTLDEHNTVAGML